MGGLGGVLSRPAPLPRGRGALPSAAKSGTAGCANGAPRLSLLHCSVSGPHGGGQRPSPLVVGRGRWCADICCMRPALHLCLSSGFRSLETPRTHRAERCVWELPATLRPPQAPPRTFSWWFAALTYSLMPNASLSPSSLFSSLQMKTGQETRKAAYPPVVARATVEALKATGTTPPAALTRGVVCAHREKTHAAQQCVIEAQTPMSTAVHQTHVRNAGRGGGGWQQVISIPEIPSPSPESQNKLGLQREPENRTAKFHGYKSCGSNTQHLLWF